MGEGETETERKKNKRGMGKNSIIEKSEVPISSPTRVCPKHFKTSSATSSAFSVYSYLLRDT